MVALLVGCAFHPKKLSIEEIHIRFADINLSDGADKTEIALIAQNYMLTTIDGKCREAKKYNVTAPVVIGRGNAWFVGFKPKGFRPFKMPVYVFVGLEPNEVKCLGEMVYK